MPSHAGAIFAMWFFAMVALNVPSPCSGSPEPVGRKVETNAGANHFSTAGWCSI